MKRTLFDIRQGESGRITEIIGGYGFKKKLHNLGIKEGQHIEKVSSIGMGGPIIIKINRAQVAIGRGMSRKILLNSGRSHDDQEKQT